MNVRTGLKYSSKIPNANKQKPKPKMPIKIYSWYLIGGTVLSSILILLQPSIKSPLWFGLSGIVLIAFTAYLLLFKSFSFSVGKVPILISEESSDEYKTVNKVLRDSKPFHQLPASLKIAHMIGLSILWILFISTTAYLIYLSF